MTSLLTTLRRAARRLFRTPGFSLPMVAILALGIGTAAAVLALVHGVLLRPLPYPDPDRLVTIRHDAPGLGITDGGHSSGTVQLYRAENRSFSGLGAYYDREFSLTDGDVPERIQAAIISDDFFAVMGVPPLLGRLLLPTDPVRTVVISHELWQRRYGADPQVVGRTIEINRSAGTIVGVMPPGFSFPSARTQLWYATPPGTTHTAGIGVRMFLGTVARLRPGVTPDAATRDVRRLIATLSQAYPDATPELLRSTRLTGTVIPLEDVMLRDVRPMLSLLLAAAVLLLLMVWANAASLVLLRAERQQQEIAVQLTLGATTGDLTRRFLAEALVLAVPSGALGLAIAYAAVRGRFGLDATQIPRLADAELVAPATVVAVALTLLSAALVGALSIGQASRTLKSGKLLTATGRTTAGRERRRVQTSLVATQIALALSLLIASGALARSFQRLAAVDLGFEPGGVVLLDTALPARAYGAYRPAARFHAQLLEQLRAVPGVQAAEGIQTGLPLTPTEDFSHDAVTPLRRDAAGAATTDTSTARSALVTPGYFQAMRIPLVAGRSFQRGDLITAERPVIVSAALARALYPEGRALGSQMRFANRREFPFAYTIVGIAGDVPGEKIAGGASQRLYLPVVADLETASPPSAAFPYDSLAPIPYTPIEMTLVVRTALPPAAVAAETRRIIHEIDPKVPVARVRTLDTVVAGSMARIRLTTVLFLLATGASLALGTIGIYGVISYAVAQRTRELGIRLAVGASPRAITTMVVGEGARIALVGIIGGLIAAVVVTRLLRGLLYQVSPTDPAAFVLMPLLLLVVVLLAAYLPARRAGRVDAVTALRME